MCNDGVASVHDTAVIAAFVEHTDIQADDVCHVYGTGKSTFIGGDDHHMVRIYLETLNML